MPLAVPTPTPEQLLILARVGDVDPTSGLPRPANSGGIVSQNIGALWDYYADRDLIAPRLRSLYCMRDAYDLQIAVLQDEVDVSVGQGALSEKLSQRTERLCARKEETQKEIERIEARAARNRPLVVGQLTQTAPVMAPPALVPPLPPGVLPDPNLPQPPAADPNSPVWSGSPLWPDPDGRSVGPL